MRQLQALSVMLEGNSVFLTGPPGAGKTYVLNQFIERARRRGKVVAVTASTGIAATHIGGTTIHSWSGLGIKDVLSDWDKERLGENQRLTRRYNETDILVIDEVSMLHGNRLNLVNECCKLLRRNDEPFGGLQVVLVGDLFQLPPISRYGEMIDFVHRSTAWQELSPKICYITEQHRQVNPGDGLLDLLQAMRRGDINDAHEELLRERMSKSPEQGTTATMLYTHNIDVDTINDNRLKALEGTRHTFVMASTGTAAKVEQFTKTLLAPEKLTLAEGAEVMFVANDFVRGFANGSRGRVVDFENGQPIVEMTSGRHIKVEPHEWSLIEDGKTRATVSQLPLRLAWAITIHKSQGMSLDAAVIDLSRSFAPGMGYVALSRVRSVDGIYLKGINNQALQLHPDIFVFDSEISILSHALANITDDASEEDEAPEIPVAETNDELLEALKQWRTLRAADDKMPAYIIAHDSVLEGIATRQPTTAASLSAIKGLGPMKIKKFGDELLAIIKEYA